MFQHFFLSTILNSYSELHMSYNEGISSKQLSELFGLCAFMLLVPTKGNLHAPAYNYILSQEQRPSAPKKVNY